MLDSVRAKEVFLRLFADPERARYGPIQIVKGPEERIPGLVFSFLGEHGDQGAVTVQLFGGLGALGGQLWEREVDALIRASRRDHPSLPTVFHGGYDDTDDVGFVVTKSTGLPIGANFEPFLRDPRWTFRCLALLTDALCHIHACGVVHRNLSPDALTWMALPNQPEEECVALSRFEFSSLIANLLRVRPRQDLRGLRALLAAQDASSLACMAPERLSEVFAGVPWQATEDPRADVFALGMIAWQWFLGPLPTEPLRAAFPAGRVDATARLALHGIVDSRLGEGGELPRELRRLLRGMLAWDVRNRLTAAEVRSELSRDFELIEATFASREEPTCADGAGRTWIVSGTVREFVDLKTWGWIESDPSLDFDGLRSFLESDLEGGVLVFEPRGFGPYDPGGNRTGETKSKMRRARWVLLGRLGAYFCSPWETGRSSVKLPWALHIRYVLRREYESARELEERLFQRRLPALRFVGHDSAFLRDLAENRDSCPSWEPFLDSVQAEPARPEWYADWRDATGFLLHWQSAELEARRYPYRLVAGSPNRGDVTVEYDWQRDMERKESHASPLVRLLLRDGRLCPSFVQFFDTLEERGSASKVAWRSSGEGGRVGQRTHGGSGYVLEPDYGETLRIRVADGSPAVPIEGWLEPDADRATKTLIDRQREARTRLLKSPALLNQLNHPRSAITLRRDWASSAADTLDPESRAAAIVPRMLRVQPFFALQGPPGTGKSTVTSLVVSALLRAEPGSRILVSAQSHSALDELAQKIVSSLGRETHDVQTIRVAGREEDVRVPMRKYMLRRQTEERVRSIERRSDELRSNPDLPPSVRSLVGRWHQDAPRAALEIEDRLRRGANLVFVTCGAATPERLGVSSEYDLFDYVFVEEAAKAWPTEVTMPLVLGLRWVLVGDHKQLSAYRREDASRLLADCETAPDQSLREHGARRTKYEDVFDFFERFFVDGTSDAVDRLDMQFRMRKPIAAVISEAFYGGLLKTSPKTEIDHGIRKPGFLADRPLVWLNTHGISGFEERRRWKNEGEARLLRTLLSPALVAQILGFDVQPNEAPLAILSPYRQQNRLLESMLPSELHGFIHTVNSFQGGQAHVVMASLVRSNAHSADDPMRALGHVAWEDLVNVMLSRACRLEIIVGDFEHFAQSGTRFWPLICSAVERYGHVLPATVAMEADR